jgi:hypothetical protein
MNASATHQVLFTTLGLEAWSCPTMTHNLRETFFTHKQIATQESEIGQDPTAIDLAIAQALNGEPFASVCQLAQRTRLPKNAVYYHLASTTKCLRWLPHALSQHQTQARIEMSKTLQEEADSANDGSTIPRTTNQSGFLAMRKCQKDNEG